MSPSFVMRSAILLVLILALLAQPVAALDHDLLAVTGGSLSVLSGLWDTFVNVFTRSSSLMEPKGQAANQENGSTLDQIGTTTTQDCERGSIMDPNGCPRP